MAYEQATPTLFDEQEEWRQIPGFPSYEASNLGRIRNKQTGKILKGSPNNRGRIQVSLCNNGVRKPLLVNRVILLAFVGPAPANCECLHEDDDHLNNRLSNLSWGTKSRNLSDAYKRKRRQVNPRGCRGRFVKKHSDQ